MAGHPIFAALYDRMPAGAERAGLAERRAAGFDLSGIEADRLPRGGFLFSPAIRGTAKPPSG